MDEICRKDEIELKKKTFSFLWQLHDMKEGELYAAAKIVTKKYSVDVSDKLSNAAIHLRHVYD